MTSGDLSQMIRDGSLSLRFKNYRYVIGFVRSRSLFIKATVPSNTKRFLFDELMLYNLVGKLVYAGKTCRLRSDKIDDVRDRSIIGCLEISWARTVPSLLESESGVSMSFSGSIEFCCEVAPSEFASESSLV